MGMNCLNLFLETRKASSKQNFEIIYDVISNIKMVAYFRVKINSHGYIIVFATFPFVCVQNYLNFIMHLHYKEAAFI